MGDAGRTKDKYRAFSIPSELMERVLNNGNALEGVNDSNKKRIGDVIKDYEGIDCNVYFLIVEGIHQGKLEEILEQLEENSSRIKATHPYARRYTLYDEVDGTHHLFEKLYSRLGIPNNSSQAP